MKYSKIAFIGFLCAFLFSSCKNEEANYGPGDAKVYFTLAEDGSAPTTESIEITVNENTGLFTIPLKYEGTPGGFPVVVNISAEGLTNVDDVDDVAYITSKTIKITQSNNSFVQIRTVNRPESQDDYAIKLTITEVKGANIGKTKECIVNIKNSFSIRYGMYTFTPLVGSPAEWTLILREGPDGTYIIDNMFDSQLSPRFVGTYNETQKELIFDGTVSGKTENYFGYPVQYGKQYLYFSSGTTGSTDPIRFSVSDEWELKSTTGKVDFYLCDADDNGNLTPVEIIGQFNRGTLEYIGESIDKPWPFE